jgi:ribosomal-protein-alanine N-acetyltransferase
MLKELFRVSRKLHEPWIYMPDENRLREVYMKSPTLYFVCRREIDKPVGAFNISNIVRGYFQSAFLGFYGFVPHQGKGFMSQGLSLLLKKAFSELNLHRLEANIQPDNKASITLVSRAGFRKEGYSPNYLQVGGEWKDHERWAILNDNWGK